MAKKPSQRRMGKYMKGRVDENLSLGTLAPVTLISDTFDEVVDEETRITSIVASWALELLTAGQGPIEVGYAHSDYTDAEIEEVLENTDSWTRGDKISQERAKRLVRSVGIFGSGSADGEEITLNNGLPVKTKLNWALTTGQTIKFWAFNRSGSAISTTVPVVRLQGHANLFAR